MADAWGREARPADSRAGARKAGHFATGTDEAYDGHSGFRRTAGYSIEFGLPYSIAAAPACWRPASVSAVVSLMALA